jgi:DNA-binding response OmpR family regulator
MLHMATNHQSTILYVARESTERVVLTDALRKAGFHVLEATTGSDALARVAEKPQLILVDLDLADMSGFELCRKLKADPAVAAIPVLLMSETFAEEADRLQALAADADDYLLQPIDPGKLVEHIKALLQARSNDDSSEASPEEP